MLRHFFRDPRGNVSVLSALLITSLIGTSGLVVEFGNGLLARLQDQRAADLAAMGGATIYNSTNSLASVTAAVANIAALNGISSGNVTASLVSSPSGDGNQAVQVTVATSVPLVLSRVFWTHSSLPVSVSSYAELKAGAPACIIAMKTSGTGVTLSGGTTISAPACAVASNNTVTVPCGDYITTKTVDYDSSAAPSEPCNGIQPPAGTSTVTLAKLLTSDPLAGTSEVTSGTSRLSTVAALTSPSGPSVTGGTAISFGYSTSPTQSQLTAAGCSSAFSGNTWTVTCPGVGPFTFGAISLGGGITVNFNTGASASNTAVYNFNGQINNSGTALHFGNGTFNITQGILTGGGSTTTFGSGKFNIGASSSSCNGYSNYSICNTGTLLSIGGPSTFVFAGGIYNSGGETLWLGSSSSSTYTNTTTNSFNIGMFTSGDSFVMGGGATTYFADATGTGDLFQMAGNFNVTGGGGSCVAVSAAAEHDINGFFSVAGGTTLGSGIYTVSKYVGLGSNGGGDVTCSGTTVGMNGTNVTFVLGGTSTMSSGSCSGQIFCIAAGYNHVTLTAPSSGGTQGLVVVGPTTSSNTYGATFAEGASNTSLSGAFYFPYGPITLSGGATVGNGSGQCLELIGQQITLTGGTAVGTTCNIPGVAGSSGATVALVQ